MRHVSRLRSLLVALMTVGGAAAACAAGPAPGVAADAPAETGLAAVYSDRLHGRKTASGERYDRSRLTAAHNALPFGTRVKVTHARNSKSVIVRINDRGPVHAGRILDLSPTAARALGIGPRGMGEVSAQVVEAAPQRAKP